MKDLSFGIMCMASVVCSKAILRRWILSFCVRCYFLCCWIWAIWPFTPSSHEHKTLNRLKSKTTKDIYILFFLFWNPSRKNELFFHNKKLAATTYCKLLKLIWFHQNLHTDCSFWLYYSSNYGYKKSDSESHVHMLVQVLLCHIHIKKFLVNRAKFMNDYLFLLCSKQA